MDRRAWMGLVLGVLCLLGAAGASRAEEAGPDDLVGRWSIDGRATLGTPAEDTTPSRRFGDLRVAQTGGWNNHLTLHEGDAPPEVVACELWLREDGTADLMASFLPTRALGTPPFATATWSREGDRVVLDPVPPTEATDLPTRIVVDDGILRVYVEQGLRKEITPLGLSRLPEPVYRHAETSEPHILTLGEALLLLEQIDVGPDRVQAGGALSNRGGNPERLRTGWSAQARYPGGAARRAEVVEAIESRVRAAFERPGFEVVSHETQEHGPERAHAWRLMLGESRRGLVTLATAVDGDDVVARLDLTETIGLPWHEALATTALLTWIFAGAAFALYLALFLLGRRRRTAEVEA